MLALYLVPTTIRHTSREPVVRLLATTCPGFRRMWAHYPRATLTPYTLFVVEADTFAPLDADARVVRLWSGASLAAILDADAAPQVVPVGVTTRLTAMGVTAGATETRRDLFRLIASRLEPALHDRSYNLPSRDLKGTITDDFNRANGGLGANWEETISAGTPDIVIASNQASYGGASFELSYWRRTEASFPDTQYTEMDTRHLTSEYAHITPGTRMSNDGDGYTPGSLDSASDLVGLYRKDDAGSFFIAGYTATITDNTTYNLRIVSTGTSHEIFLDDVSIGADTDGTYASGRPGMCSEGITGLTPTGDNWESTSPVGAGGPPAGFLQNVPIKGGGLLVAAGAYPLWWILQRRRQRMRR